MKATKRRSKLLAFERSVIVPNSLGNIHVIITVQKQYCVNKLSSPVGTMEKAAKGHRSTLDNKGVCPKPTMCNELLRENGESLVCT